VSRSSRSKARSRDRRKRAAPRRSSFLRPAPDAPLDEVEITSSFPIPLTARGLRRILRLVGITPEIVEQWSADGEFPVPGTTAGTVERWLSGVEPIPEEAGEFLRERETEFLEETESGCQWYVDEMHGMFGGYDRKYKVSPLIYDDESLQAKYDPKDVKWIPLPMHHAYWRHQTRLLGAQGIETIPVPFVENEYLAFLEERGRDHSPILLQEWTVRKAERMHLAKGDAKAREVRKARKPKKS
jgi:hypothetical protein